VTLASYQKAVYTRLAEMESHTAIGVNHGELQPTKEWQDGLQWTSNPLITMSGKSLPSCWWSQQTS